MSHTTSPPHRPLTALVTGGGGFLGLAVVEQLLARGDRVRSFARGVYPGLAALGVEVLRGDLRDAQVVGQACAGCDVVFHVAAKAGIWGRYAVYYEPNVRGTQNVLAACREHGVHRLVYTSSPSVVFDGRSMEGVDESAPYPQKYHSHYSATKALAEQAVLAANGKTLRTLALRPHLIWGPRDNHLVPRIVSQGRAGTLRRVGDGTNKVDTTYIDNAARAHLLAADALETNPQAAGRPFFISQGEPMALSEIINGILAAAGLPPPHPLRAPTRRLVGRRDPGSRLCVAPPEGRTTHDPFRRPRAGHGPLVRHHRCSYGARLRTGHLDHRGPAPPRSMAPGTRSAMIHSWPRPVMELQPRRP